MRKILSVDPGLTQSGVALISGKENQFLVLKSCLPKSAYKDWVNVSQDIVQYTLRWFVELTQTIDEEEILDVAIEEPFSTPMRAGSVAKQNRLFGALVNGLCNNRQIGDIYSVHPRSMKKIFTGNGNAEKPRIVKRAILYYDVRLWPASKADKEALADAIGIGYSLWKHRKFKRNGVNMIRKSLCT